jgi:hypothetical protein
MMILRWWAVDGYGQQMMILRWWAVDIFVMGIGFFIFLMKHNFNG